jgi:hypothetical protein
VKSLGQSAADPGTATCNEDGIARNLRDVGPVELKNGELLRKAFAEDGKPPLRLGPRCFHLGHIAVLGQLAVLEADDVGSDPGRRPAISGKAAMRDDVIILRENELVLIAQRRRQRADEVEQPSRPGSIWALREIYRKTGNVWHRHDHAC